MTDRNSLFWVQRNRAPAQTAQELGDLVGRIVSTLPSRRTPAEMAVRVLRGVPDRDFRLHCRVASVGGGRIRIHVDRPELVDVLRIRWHFPLRNLLASTRELRGIDQVEFSFGRTGTVLIEEDELNG